MHSLLLPFLLVYNFPAVTSAAPEVVFAVAGIFPVTVVAKVIIFLQMIYFVVAAALAATVIIVLAAVVAVNILIWLQLMLLLIMLLPSVFRLKYWKLFTYCSTSAQIQYSLPSISVK